MTSVSYPLATETWNDAEYSAIQRVISSGNFTMGQEVSNFEKKFAEYHDRKHAVMVNSGSSANLLMVASLFFKKEKFPTKFKIFIWDKIFTPISIIIDFLLGYKIGKCILAVYKKTN